MKPIKIFSVLACLLLMSCDKNTVYKDFDNGFEDNRWLLNDIREYDFTIEEPGKTYDLFVDFSHVADFQFAEVPLKIAMKHPDGSMTSEDIILKIKDVQGNDLGDCSGDYCDLQQPVFKNRSLGTGDYTIRVANAFGNVYLPNVIGIGIRLKLSKSE